MLTALINGFITTLFIYLVLGISYSLFFISMKKSNLFDKKSIPKFVKQVAIMHGIYFIPIVILSMLNYLNQHIIVVILAVILATISYPISKSVSSAIQKTKENNK